MIRFENVYKSFEINNLNQVILNNINFHIEKEDIVAIVGNTGSGKSTLLKLMNGFLKQESGSIYIDNNLLTRESRKTIVKDMQTIFQSYNLLNNLNVLNNVLLPAKFRKLDKKTSLVKARELIDFVGLKGHELSYPKTLSGGEKQRAAIARALISNPKILLADEPTSALDLNMSYEILSLLKKTNKLYKTTIVIISHDVELIKTIANKIIVLEDGLISNIIINEPKEFNKITYKERLLNDSSIK